MVLISKQMGSHSQLNDRAKNVLRRRAEDVDYWRQRAGWFDDDASMKEYNSGIYDAYYQPGDDDNHSRGRGGGGIMSNVTRGSQSEAVKNAIKVLAVLVSVALMVLLCRVISRRIGSDSKDKKKSKKTSDSKRSPSRSRSRSRSRKAEGYDLMDDEDGRSRKSNRSSRSKSKRKKSRSRSRQRSRSTSRTKQRSPAEAAPAAEKKDAVLV